MQILGDTRRSTDLYLDLLKRCLTRVLFPDSAVGHDLAPAGPTIPGERAEGRDWPSEAETMIGLRRLDNLQACVAAVIESDVPGDFVETGVWRGGASIFMRAALKAYGDEKRKVWLADSFAGLPLPEPGRYPQDAGDSHHEFSPYLAVGIDEVRENFQRYALLDDRVKFLPGWFKDTLPNAPIGRIAILRLDGDMYESTMEALVHLYDKVSAGGFVIVDDYGALPNCRAAVEDFRRERGIEDPVQPIDWTGVYWKKTAPATEAGIPKMLPAAAAAFQAITVESPAAIETFNEQGYLLSNPDVAAAIGRGDLKSGKQHFLCFGKNEKRRMRIPDERLLPVKREKMARIKSILKPDVYYEETDGMLDCLTETMRESSDLADTSAVSSNPYDGPATETIHRLQDGLILDCGAGRRPIYYSNVVNFEIVAYDTTDVRGVGESLPFETDSFDAVFSFAVLEHVKDPFRCASEICRVLKPGGILQCVVPFLQPLHGYPHHYYNMSYQGIRSLFANKVNIESQKVPDYGLPIWSLTWILNSWAQGLTGAAKEEFLHKRVSDLTGPPESYLNQRFVRALTDEKNFELASVTWLQATKPVS